MSNEYRMHWPSSNSIGFSKLDETGKQSNFYVYVLPIEDGAEKLTPLIVVDSELKTEKRFFREVEPNAKTVIKEFHKWAPDAPPDCALEIGQHLGKYFQKSNVTKEKSIEVGVGTDGANVKGGYKKKRESK